MPDWNQAQTKCLFSITDQKQWRCEERRYWRGFRFRISIFPVLNTYVWKNDIGDATSECERERKEFVCPGICVHYSGWHIVQPNERLLWCRETTIDANYFTLFRLYCCGVTKGKNMNEIRCGLPVRGPSLQYLRATEDIWQKNTWKQRLWYILVWWGQYGRILWILFYLGGNIETEERRTTKRLRKEALSEMLLW